MLNDIQLTNIVKKNLSGWVIKKSVDYGNLKLFMVDSLDPEEGMFDPFFSVDKGTGEFSDFSILTDGDTEKILGLFSK